MLTDGSCSGTGFLSLCRYRRLSGGLGVSLALKINYCRHDLAVSLGTVIRILGWLHRGERFEGSGIQFSILEEIFLRFVIISVVSATTVFEGPGPKIS